MSAIPGNSRPISWLGKFGPGIALAIIAAALAHGLHAVLPAIPALTASVALGILCANIPPMARLLDGIFRAGIGFSSKKFMRLGIVLLGLKLSIVDVAGLGWPTLLVVIAIVILTFFGTLWGGRLLGLPGDQPLLMAAGFSICGASAIGAMSGAAGSKDRDSGTPIAMVTLCGTLAIAVLPLLRGPLGLSDTEFGFWVGASVHDVGQVVATAQTAGAGALAIAVIIKLTRVLMLAPMVTTTALVMRSRARAAGTTVTGTMPPIVPLFVIGFLAAVALRSMNIVPEPALDIAATLQDWLLATALFALGAGVRLRELWSGGVRAIVLALLSWALVAALSLGAILILDPGAV